MTNDICLEKEVAPNQVVVVDATMAVTNTIGWEKAVTMIMNRDAYVLLPRSDGSVLRSQNFSMPLPLVVCMNRYVPRFGTKAMNNDDKVSRQMILIRDNWTCQYCFEYGDTIDHIYPKSRGGGNTWGNLCVACKKCNGYKSDSTLEEVGYKAPKIPKVFEPNRRVRLQEAVYRAIQDATSV